MSRRRLIACHGGTNQDNTLDFPNLLDGLRPQTRPTRSPSTGLAISDPIRIRSVIGDGVGVWPGGGGTPSINDDKNLAWPLNTHQGLKLRRLSDSDVIVQVNGSLARVII